ncbi:MAG: hypothetical protein GTN40_00225 [Candidatus Aenigmarchaeota archaeon]|nr:hypothetical protein [Candidatus Aenigmarchaeota archaeon]
MRADDLSHLEGIVISVISYHTEIDGVTKRYKAKQRARLINGSGEEKSSFGI